VAQAISGYPGFEDLQDGVIFEDETLSNQSLFLFTISAIEAYF